MLHWKVFFHLSKSLLLFVGFSYIYVSQINVETHSGCGGIYNNHIIANCLQSVPMQKILKIGQ